MKNLILSIFLLSAMAASAQTHIRSGKPTYTIVNNKPVATFQTENTQTGLIDYVAKKDFTEAGMQNFLFSIPKRGIYVVSLIINGNVYEKKIVIK